MPQHTGRVRGVKRPPPPASRLVATVVNSSSATSTRSMTVVIVIVIVVVVVFVSIQTGRGRLVFIVSFPHIFRLDKFRVFVATLVVWPRSPTSRRLILELNSSRFIFVCSVSRVFQTDRHVEVNYSRSERKK